MEQELIFEWFTNSTGLRKVWSRVAMIDGLRGNVFFDHQILGAIGDFCFTTKLSELQKKSTQIQQKFEELFSLHSHLAGGKPEVLFTVTTGNGVSLQESRDNRLKHSPGQLAPMVSITTHEGVKLLFAGEKTRFGNLSRIRVQVTTPKE